MVTPDYRQAGGIAELGYFSRFHPINGHIVCGYYYLLVVCSQTQRFLAVHIPYVIS